VAAAGLAAVVVAAPAAPAVASSVSSPGAATDAPTWHRAQELRLPSGAAAPEDQASQLTSVSCPAAGDCVAGGSYTNGIDAIEGMVISQVHGRWHRARLPVFPAGGGKYAQSAVTGVSCGAVGYCVAAGDYEVGSSDTEVPFIDSQSHGVWAKARRVLLPAGAGAGAGVSGQLNDVTCPKRGSCEALGTFSGSHRSGAMMVTQVRGRWQRAVQVSSVTGPRGTMADPYSLSCHYVGSCVAAGTANGEPGGYYAESRGRWGRVRHASLGLREGKARGWLAEGGVACPPAGACTAAGSYPTPSGAEAGWVMTESGGKWRHATRVRPPSNALTTKYGDVEINGLTCTSRGSCVAVGSYAIGQNRTLAMAVIESKGRWERGVAIAPPANIYRRYTLEDFQAAACAGVSYCVAVGNYVGPGNNLLPIAAARTRN
jgi:hypothetical protein